MRGRVKLLAGRDLPPGFSYPEGFAEAAATTPLTHWEWLSGARLREAAQELWRQHRPTLVPFAVRKGTTFMVCFDADDQDAYGVRVRTVNAADGQAAPVQEASDVFSWLKAAETEELQAGPTPGAEPADADPQPAPSESSPPPADQPTGQVERQDVGDHQPWELAGEDDEGRGDDEDAGPHDAFDGLPPWREPERGQCYCRWHSDEVATEVVPYGKHVDPSGLPQIRVAELLMDKAIVAQAVYPGPRVTTKRGEAVPLHWQVRLSKQAMLHYDEDGRVPLGLWVLRNPFVEFLVPGEEGQFFVNAPWLCVDGVTTMFARALLDDRVRRRR